ncbi:response regulator transcription factor [Hyphobacterium marinum]|uniref:Response regulator transcription factor n=1 Tax=Hyphobacterium marinum TaxID=3116574 RepID=A0ABU7LU21_9PROT|nr:response regulator transcription factor [Hyphobacterium sp. Y6023]MEE2565053.1 response regulator transcription factor [Hyphobacterium sp. Y6023]
MSRPRKIALVDDHRLFADGFRSLLTQSDIDCEVTVYDEPAGFLEAFAGGEPPDLIVLDLVMRGMNGLALLAAVRGQRKSARVLMLSGITSAAPVNEMKRLGASGFVHKSADTAVLLDAVETILGGRTYFQDVAEAGLVDDGGDSGDWAGAAELPQLGPRQLDVLTLMGQGVTNRDIAEALDISENTVKSHMRAIFESLQVRTRTACVRKAQALGFI